MSENASDKLGDRARNLANTLRIRHHLRPRSVGRFAMIGGLNTLIGIGSFPLLYCVFGRRLGVNNLLVAAWMLSTIFAFLSHKYVTFESGGKSSHEAAKFLLLSLTTLGINLAVMNLALSLTSINPVVIQIFTSVVFAAIMLILGYLGMNYFIFRPADKKPEPRR